MSNKIKSNENWTLKQCSECGQFFLVSKFNPYYDKCKTCRKGTFEKIVVTCAVCGEVFTTSKFTPYFMVCDECLTSEAYEDMGRVA